MNKLLIICGPTATGKTKLALHLAKAVNGEVISADSRQVYKSLNIGTGKDLPPEGKILGYDLANPKEEFSVADYIGFARAVLADIYAQGKLPILVGGTGLYIKAVVDGIETAFIPRDKSLREAVGKKSPEKLFRILFDLDPGRANSMNASDKANPRRLIRAIEVAKYQAGRSTWAGRFQRPRFDAMFIGLTAPKKDLDKRIEKRVDKRVNAGIEKEIKDLLARGVSWDSQAMTSLGYQEWQDYFSGTKEAGDVINKWKQDEIGYAKRQMTWFKKDKRIKWFNINRPGWEKKVELSVKKWYDTKK